jgi:membrane protease YdiL (CAAX protease family)
LDKIRAHWEKLLKTTTAIFRPVIYIVWGAILVWGVVFGNNIIYDVVSRQNPNIHVYVNDILSDIVLLFAGFMPVVWAPHFFGYQAGSISKHWKMLLGMAIFFVAAPLLYRLIAGAAPFGANTWFFEGVVVPLAEESLMRGVLFSLLLWGFKKMYKDSTAGWLTLLSSTLIFATSHLNNLGSYPTGFILFQVGFSTIVGLAFGYTRLKTDSIYPAIILHALFNLAGTI